jgi:hypothetical protein
LTSIDAAGCRRKIRPDMEIDSKELDSPSASAILTTHPGEFQYDFSSFTPWIRHDLL